MDTATATQNNGSSPKPNPQIQPCRYKVGRTLGAGSYSVVKECVHIDTGRYYAAKVINKRLMAGREHMVSLSPSAPDLVTAGHGRPAPSRVRRLDGCDIDLHTPRTRNPI